MHRRGRDNRGRRGPYGGKGGDGKGGKGKGGDGKGGKGKGGGGKGGDGKGRDRQRAPEPCYACYSRLHVWRDCPNVTCMYCGSSKHSALYCGATDRQMQKWQDAQ